MISEIIKLSFLGFVKIKVDSIGSKDSRCSILMFGDSTIIIVIWAILFVDFILAANLFTQTVWKDGLKYFSLVNTYAVRLSTSSFCS